MQTLHFPRWRWRILVLALLAGLTLIGLRPLPASAQVESRLTQLEFEVRGLRSQLSQIESRLSQSGGGTAPPVRNPPSTVTIPGDPSLEDQFDNLATLAIELKQQVRALENRVSQLEQQAR